MRLERIPALPETSETVPVSPRPGPWVHCRSAWSFRRPRRLVGFLFAPLFFLPFLYFFLPPGICVLKDFRASRGVFQSLNAAARSQLPHGRSNRVEGRFMDSSDLDPLQSRTSSYLVYPAFFPFFFQCWTDVQETETHGDLLPDVHPMPVQVGKGAVGWPRCKKHPLEGQPKSSFGCFILVALNYQGVRILRETPPSLESRGLWNMAS